MDSDLPYLSAQKQNIEDLFYILDLAPYSLRSTVLNIKEQYPKSGIYKASIYKELDIFSEFINLDKVFVVNRISQKGYSLSNIILNIKLFFLFIKLRIDVLQITNWFDYSRLYFYLLRKKIIIATHDPLPHTGETSLDDFYRMIALKICRNFLIFNSFQKDEFIERYKLQSKNVFVTRFGVFNYMKCFISNKKNNGYKNPYILYFGRISPYKGIEFLLEAMKEVHHKHPNVKLVVAGNGKYYFDKTEYEKLPFIVIQNRFIPIGELAQYIEGCLFTICPYTDATQSGVISTSFGLSKPVIATNVGGLSEMIDHGKTGILIEPKNTLQLTESICELLEDEAKLKMMENTIQNRYFNGGESWDSIAKEIKQFYTVMKKEVNS